ncbi:unnamed protein product [Prorocentrum cordatum]|uniref:Uncharacterized protein n=1 Tax=Prorocentrum cordatum TaxID=2364126 RepID=A0ABN9VR06_9DINO|nr:unnamed protein product [Polarella glacialis]
MERAQAPHEGRSRPGVRPLASGHAWERRAMRSRSAPGGRLLRDRGPARARAGARIAQSPRVPSARPAHPSPRQRSMAALGLPVRRGAISMTSAPSHMSHSAVSWSSVDPFEPLEVMEQQLADIKTPEALFWSSRDAGGGSSLDEDAFGVALAGVEVPLPGGSPGPAPPGPAPAACAGGGVGPRPVQPQALPAAPAAAPGGCFGRQPQVPSGLAREPPTLARRRPRRDRAVQGSRARGQAQHTCPAGPEALPGRLHVDQRPGVQGQAALPDRAHTGWGTGAPWGGLLPRVREARRGQVPAVRVVLEIWWLLQRQGRLRLLSPLSGGGDQAPQEVKGEPHAHGCAGTRSPGHQPEQRGGAEPRAEDLGVAVAGCPGVGASAARGYFQPVRQIESSWGTYRT